MDKVRDRIKSFTVPSYITYLAIFIGFLIIPIAVILGQFGATIFLNDSLDSSRYLLSALAQSLAAILAIVLGFSFVAFQLSARLGTHRVFDLILKDWVFWSLLIIYGFSILYDLVLLRMLTEETVGSLVNWINFSVILGFISFAALFPYTHRTIDRLRPEKMIQDIIKIRNDDADSIKHDTILPIAEIMNNAIRANDPHTLEVGLEELEKLNIEKINSGIDSKDKLEIVKYSIGKTSRLAEVAIKVDDESAVMVICDSLGNIGLRAIESRWMEVPEDEKAVIITDTPKVIANTYGIGLPDRGDNYDNIAREIKEVLRTISEKVIERGWEKATRSILSRRGELLVKSSEELVLYNFYDVFEINRDFSLSLSKEGKFFSMEYFMGVICNIVVELIERDIYFEDWQFNNVIKDILEKSLEVIDKDSCYKISRVMNPIVDVGIKAAEKNHGFKEDVKEHFKIAESSEKCPGVAISCIGNKGFSMESASKKDETLWICSCLKDIGVLCASKGLDEPTQSVFSFLEGIENNYNNYRQKNKSLEVTENIIEIIEELGNISIEKGLKRSSREVFNSLIEIGMRNEDENLKTRICEILKHMHQKIEDKEIFNSAITLYGYGTGLELDDFKKFRDFCGFDRWL